MKAKNNLLFVVTSSINFSVEDTKTVFSVVGIADNKERAKEMLKEEVEQFFASYNERFVSEDPDELYGPDEPLSVDNKNHFPNAEWYMMKDPDLGVFCEVKIEEKKLNS